MTNIDWKGASYKEWVGLSAAPIFWIASLVCFVLGLSFKEGTGINIPGTSLDLAILFSIGLGLANTAIQIVGNDTEKEELGFPLFLMWLASYALGIGSNVNFLYSIIGISQKFPQFLVCWGLGIMVEVAPERLLVRWLRGVGVLKSSNFAQKPQRRDTETNSNNQRREVPQGLPKKIQEENVSMNGNNPGRMVSRSIKSHGTRVQDTGDLPEFIQKRKDHGKMQA